MMCAGYPEDWDVIAKAVKEAAGWLCEHCGHVHEVASGYVLTVHHLDGDPANCDDSNLVRCVSVVTCTGSIGLWWVRV